MFVDILSYVAYAVGHILNVLAKKHSHYITALQKNSAYLEPVTN